MIRWRTFRLSKPSCLTQVTNTHTSQEVTMFHKRWSLFGKAQNRILHKQHTCIWISFEFEKSRLLLSLHFFPFTDFNELFHLHCLFCETALVSHFSFKILRGKLARGRPVLPYIWLLRCRWLPRTPYDLGLRRSLCKSNFGGAVFQCNMFDRFLHVRKMVKRHIFYFSN